MEPMKAQLCDAGTVRSSIDEMEWLDALYLNVVTLRDTVACMCRLSSDYHMDEWIDECKIWIVCRVKVFGHAVRMSRSEWQSQTAT